ncbi:unnamed protein product [Adineta ricciae]|uniref:G-protein coupled receptors family 1 profile domain-containing protein n=1 Tax=Adineta ricciae TaxID=249248 RepID=A0A813RZI7_ADIRI|nr:unnamed protein product [Adineta ricciae]CAF1181652.1 unnamed protein product [Adineta ricciae]
MESWIISFLDYFSKQLAIYLGTVMLLAGLVGGFLTIVVFLSLHTFRNSSCAFYLLVMSIFNIGNLLGGLLTRIVITGLGIDWTISSQFYCAFRWYYLYSGVLTSFTMICFATIDQYFATCTRPRWQRWSNIKLARWLSFAVIITWPILATPYMLYFKVIEQSPSGKLVCTSVNKMFYQYHTYVYIITLSGTVPIVVTLIFGYLAYRNVQTLAHRTLPLVRRELDKQMTKMVLVQVVHNGFASIPYVIVIAIMNSSSAPTDPVSVAKLQFFLLLTIYFYYFNYVSPFYIYLGASERFRHQLFYVLLEIHLKRWRRRQTAVGQIDQQLYTHA